MKVLPDMHRSGKQADWERIDPRDRAPVQKVAAATGLGAVATIGYVRDALARPEESELPAEELDAALLGSAE